MSNRKLPGVWLALVCGALFACSGAAPESEQSVEPPAAEAPPSGLQAPASVEATGDQADAPAQDAEPAGEEEVAGDPPADEDDEQVAEVPVVGAPAAVPAADVPVTDEPIAEVPTVIEGAEDLPALPVADDPTLDPGTDSPTIDSAAIDLCTGVVDGFYCATSLDPSSDPSVLVQCSEGFALVSTCPGKCDETTSDCQHGPGTGESSADSSDLEPSSACYRCLDRSCEDEREACVATPECSAEFPCLTTCDPSIVDCVEECNYDFAKSGDGGWRTCAIDSCSQECDL